MRDFPECRLARVLAILGPRRWRVGRLGNSKTATGYESRSIAGVSRAALISSAKNRSDAHEKREAESWLNAPDAPIWRPPRACRLTRVCGLLYNSLAGERGAAVSMIQTPS